jgi:hypothetical protein
MMSSFTSLLTFFEIDLLSSLAVFAVLVYDFTHHMEVQQLRFPGSVVFKAFRRRYLGFFVYLIFVEELIMIKLKAAAKTPK